MMRATELICDHGGRRHRDESAALAWRKAFIRMPYARELTVPLGVINDTFETAVTWDKFEAFHLAVSTATAAALKEATARAGTVSIRFTHVYPDGPAPYYTFNVSVPQDNSSNSGDMSRAAPRKHCLEPGEPSPTITPLAVTTCLGISNNALPCSAGHSKQPRARLIPPESSIREFW
jgi:hypothetical protein